MSRLRELASMSRVRELVKAIREGDEAMVEAAVLRMSRSRRWLAPLALAVGALEMLFQGVKLVFSNWRLTVVQVLPAMWIWLAMLDLKAHVLHGRSFHVLSGPIVIPAVALIAAITAAAFFLNAVFAFAIAGSGRPEVRPGFAGARRHLPVVLGSGAAVGLLLGLSTVVVTRWGRPWFSLSLGVVIGLLMVCYVAVPSSLIGIKPAISRRDKLTASAVSGALGALVSTPPYLLGRIGLLMLGSHVLFIPGIFVVAVGFTLQAGATGAVKAVKLSAHLVAGGASTPDLSEQRRLLGDAEQAP
jgi:hypothetical protein